MYCAKLIHSHLLSGQLLHGLKSSIIGCVLIFLWLCGLKSSCNNSCLINLKCEWTLIVFEFAFRQCEQALLASWWSSVLLETTKHTITTLFVVHYFWSTLTRTACVPHICKTDSRIIVFRRKLRSPVTSNSKRTWFYQIW